MTPTQTWEHCAHHALSTRTHRGSAFDDHDTEYGYCPDCDTWLVVTTMRTSGASEARPLTTAELARLEGYAPC